MSRAVIALLAAAACSTSIGGGAGESDAGSEPVADAAPGGTPDATVAPPDAAAGPPDAAPPPDARPACEEGDNRVQDPETGTCYLFFQAPLSWVNAEAACVALGGHLVAPTSLIENTFASQIVPGNRDVWIGASDQASEDVFAWTTGDAFAFDHWRSGEPNNGGSGGEDCAVMEGDNNIPGQGCLWDDRGCGAGLPYLCERP